MKLNSDNVLRPCPTQQSTQLKAIWKTAKIQISNAPAKTLLEFKCKSRIWEACYPSVERKLLRRQTNIHIQVIQVNLVPKVSCLLLTQQHWYQEINPGNEDGCRRPFKTKPKVVTYVQAIHTQTGEEITVSNKKKHDRFIS